MAVTIPTPTLQRIQPSESLPNTERISVRASDNSSDILSRTNSIVDVAEKGADIYQKYEDQTIASLSQEAEIEYKTWNDQQLQNLKSYEGDPTDAYVQHDKAAKEKYEEILNKRPDLNERVKRHLTASLNKTASDESVAVLKQRGAQQETYQNNLYESTVKLKKNDLSTRAGYIQKDDPGSYFEMDKGINDIRTTIAERSINKGLGEVLPDDAKSWDHSYAGPDGKIVKIKLNDIAKQRTAKELSEGIGASIASMEAAGYVTEAKQAMDKYKFYLDPKTKTSLENKFQTAGVKQAAYDEIAKIRGKSESEQMNYINGQSDPEIRSEMLKIKDTDDRRIQSMKDRREKQNYEYLARTIDQRQKSGNPFYGMADLEADPQYKAQYSSLDATGRKAIQELVIAPKYTDPKAEMNMQRILFGDDPEKDLATMSPEQFNRELVGMNKQDRTKYTNQYNKARIVTPGEERSSIKVAGNLLQEQLQISGYIQKNDYGKFEGEDEINLLTAKSELIDQLDKQGPMTTKETQDFVKKFAAAKVSGQTFNPTTKKAINAPSKNDPAFTAPPKAKGNIVLTPKQKIELKKKYRDNVNNGAFPTESDPKFQNWLKSQMAGM